MIDPHVADGTRTRSGSGRNRVYRCDRDLSLPERAGFGGAQINSVAPADEANLNRHMQSESALRERSSDRGLWICVCKWGGPGWSAC